MRPIKKLFFSATEMPARYMWQEPDCSPRFLRVGLVAWVG